MLPWETSATMARTKLVPQSIPIAAFIATFSPEGGGL